MKDIQILGLLSEAQGKSASLTEGQVKAVAKRVYQQANKGVKNVGGKGKATGRQLSALVNYAIRAFMRNKKGIIDLFDAVKVVGYMHGMGKQGYIHLPKEGADAGEKVRARRVGHTSAWRARNASGSPTKSKREHNIGRWA